jgi:hypothetical protein
MVPPLSHQSLRSFRSLPPEGPTAFLGAARQKAGLGIDLIFPTP